MQEKVKNYAFFSVNSFSAMQSAVFLLASWISCAYMSIVVLTSAWPSIFATVSTSTPLDNRIDATECRKRCGFMCGKPYFSQNRQSCSVLPGKYIIVVLPVLPGYKPLPRLPCLVLLQQCHGTGRNGNAPNRVRLCRSLEYPLFGEIIQARINQDFPPVNL